MRGDLKIFKLVQINSRKAAKTILLIFYSLDLSCSFLLNCDTKIVQYSPIIVSKLKDYGPYSINGHLFKFKLD